MKEVKCSFKMLILMILLCGIAYPVGITLLGQILFYHTANGSIIEHKGKVIGSRFIGQRFTSDKYFWSRPSAIDYQPLPSNGSNLGPTSGDLKKLVNERREALASAHGVQNLRLIPDDLVFASGSGLDPHISPLAAYFQIERVATARSLISDQDKQKIMDLINALVEKHQVGFLKASRVNVLLLNKALDEL
jgi:potassium-transporting ATPase KdpC subunit